MERYVKRCRYWEDVLDKSRQYYHHILVLLLFVVMKKAVVLKLLHNIAMVLEDILEEKAKTLKQPPHTVQRHRSKNGLVASKKTAIQTRNSYKGGCRNSVPCSRNIKAYSSISALMPIL